MHHPLGQTMQSDPGDFRHLDDPAFLDERASLRERLARAPEDAAGRPELERLFEAMNEEFCRRARIAWAGAGQKGATP